MTLTHIHHPVAKRGFFIADSTHNIGGLGCASLLMAPTPEYEAP
ncbi:hypothetical protein N8654_03455 [Synechococcus sp. AH-601-B19]|nr:hypothetical protein [Synechococcus sp. AH-601-B19]